MPKSLALKSFNTKIHQKGHLKLDSYLDQVKNRIDCFKMLWAISAAMALPDGHYCTCLVVAFLESLSKS